MRAPVANDIKKMITLGISSGLEGDGAKRPGFRHIGRGVVLENLDVCAEFEPQVVEIGRLGPSNNGSRAEIRRDAVFPRELVKGTNCIIEHVLDHELGEAFKREAVEHNSASAP